MKRTTIFLVGFAMTLLGSTIFNLSGQTTDSEYSIIKRGPNDRVWEKSEMEYNSTGDAVPKKHRYTELATGLNHWKDGEWVPSSEDIEVAPDGDSAAATNGQHQVYFPGNIRNGLKLVTPSGKVLMSQPLALGYFDGTKSILLSELANASGEILPSGNQVRYPDAFARLGADVVYTYTLAGFEQDVVLRKQLPDPASLGLNQATTRLQMFTEFVDPPEPHKKLRSRKNQSPGGLTDTTLDFGGMEMGPGQAFSTTDSLRLQMAHGQLGRGRPVYKTWVHVMGRTFLIEELPFDDAWAISKKLPPGQEKSGGKSSKQQGASLGQVWPARLVRNETKPGLMRMASTDTKSEEAVVLDYFLVNTSQTNSTFTGDGTYLISGPCILSGITTIEGGAVIKMDETNSPSLQLDGALDCKTGPYRPAVFTDKNDDSVGEAITTNSVTPVTQTNGYYLRLTGATNYTVNDLRFIYAKSGLWLDEPSAYSADVWDCQFVSCQTGVNISTNNDVAFHNVLFSTNGASVSFSGGASLNGEQVTASGGALWDTNGTAPTAINLTNSIIVGAVGSGPTFNTNNVVINPGLTIFQAIGAGNYYLANNAYRNSGTTNITPSLLAELRHKTTIPPLVYSWAWIDAGLTLSQAIARDTNAAHVDLGYHYDPLDYYFDGFSVLFSGTLTVNTGIQVGFGGPFYLEPGTTVTSQGKADLLNRLVQCRVVQDEATEWAGDPTLSADSVYDSINVNCRFTEFSRLAGPGGHISDDYKGGTWNLRDCQFHGGQVSFVANIYSLSVGMTNCLLDNTKFYAGGTNLTLKAYNNLFYQEDVWLDSSYASNNFTFRNDFFCRNSLTNTITVGSLTNEYNAYVTNYTRLGTGTGDVVVTNFIFQSNWLGDFYQPADSPLIDKGNTNANLLGFYHYTTQTNQTKEYNSTLDIGYHYVATDNNGKPIDSNGDGNPDYLQDANGNGVRDGSETQWAVAPTISVQPTNQTATVNSLAGFSVSVSAGTLPLAFQWYYNNTNLLTGQTNYSLTFWNGVQLTNAGNYKVVITNAAGSVTSSNALLTVLVPPMITQQPTGQTVALEGSAVFSVTVSSNSALPLSYQWYFNNTNLLIGATNYLLALTNVQSINSGYYSVVVTNVAGSVTSSNALLTVFPLATNCVSAPSGIIAWWQAESNALDSVGTNNGTLVNSASFMSGYVGSAFQLNGSNYVSVQETPSLNPSNAITVEGWIYRHAIVGTWDPVVKKSDNSQTGGYSMEFNNSNLAFWVYNGSWHSSGGSVTVQTGQWYHVAGVYDGSQLMCYTNGRLAASTTVSGGIISSTNALHIGNDPGNSTSRFFDGLIDELSVYNRALSSNEVAAIYDAGYYGKCYPIGPVVTIDPTNVTVCPGSAATFNAESAGCSSLTYAWRFGSLTNIIGTNSSLSLSNVYSGNAGTYSVVVSGSCGSATNTATLTVLTNLAVAGPFDVSTCAGSTATLGVTAFGSGPITYQWSYGTNVLAGQTNSSLIITNVGPTNVGTYSVVVNGYCRSVTNSATLRTLSILIQPSNQSITYGESATFSVSATGYESTTYQWRKNGVNIPGANGSSYTVIAPSVSDSGSQYDVIVSSPYCTLTSSAATLTVNHASLFISANLLARAYGTTNPVLMWAATGFVLGDNTGVLSGAPQLSTAATTNSPIGNYSITISQATLSATNYSFTFTNGTLTVTQAILSVSADNKTRQYGLANPALTWSVAGFANGEHTNVLTGAPQLSTTGTTNSTIGNYPIAISLGTLTATNYSFSFTNGTLTVTTAPLSVTADNKFKLVGITNPALTGVIAGLRNNDNVTASYSTTAMMGSPAGTYPIIPTLNAPDGRLPNYNITVNNGILTVTDAPPTMLSQPPAAITVNLGDTMSIGVVADGTAPLIYQWYFNGTNAISGATGTNYIKVVTQPSDAGNYSVRVSNGVGSVMSSNTVLTVSSPPVITTQPQSASVAAGADATFTVTASGTSPLSYQWYTNGVALANSSKYGGVTTASLTVSSAMPSDAVSYSVVVSNSASSAASVGAELTVVGVSRIIVAGSSPVISGSSSIAAGSSITLEALSSPIDATFSSGYPTWSVVPTNGAAFTNGYAFGSITDVVAGQYSVTASNGTSTAQFTLTVVATNDANYDGINDWFEQTTYGTNTPQIQLGSWQFDTPDFTGMEGQLPLMDSNITQVDGWSILAAEVNSNNGPAWLSYREAETNSLISSLNLRSGTVAFRFKPDWNSAGTNGGAGPGNNGRLIEVGSRGSTNGCWGLYLEPNGTNVYFCTETNSSTAAVVQTNLMGTILWSSNDWHQLMFTYCPTNSSLYLDGDPVNTNGIGVTNWPSESVRSLGFRIGSGITGTNCAQGRFDDLQTYNYPWNGQDVRNYFKHHPQPNPTNTCLLAPIALYVGNVAGLTYGSTNTSATGGGSGNFAWLSWYGKVNANTLEEALTNWTMCENFQDPINGGTTLMVESWIYGATGWKSVDPSLDWLETSPVATNGFGVVIWNNSQGTGSSTTYQAAMYAKVRLLSYDSSAKTITYKFLGLVPCDSIIAFEPTNWIVSPTNGQVFNAPTNITIQAIASDPQGQLRSAEFYNGTNLLGTATSGEPLPDGTNELYTLKWQNVTNDGTYTLTTVATNALGLTNQSEPVSIIVNFLPQISGLTNQTLIWPDDGTNVSLTANVSEDGLPYGWVSNTWSVVGSNGPVTLLNRYTTNATAQFTTNGTYVFQMTASDGAGSVSGTCAVAIKQRPFVFITSPTNNATINPSAGTSINAMAYDYDGYVPTNGVEILDIFDGVTNVLGTASQIGSEGITNSYSLEWTNDIQPGTNILFAIATDNDGLTNVSPPVQVVTFQTAFVSLSVDDSSPCPGSTVTFTATASGTAPLSYSWFKGTDALNQTNTFLVLSNVTANDTGNYSVQVTNLYSSASAVLNLTVLPGTSAIGPTNVTVNTGQTAYFETIASGTGPFGYAWYKDGVLLNGQSASSLTTANALTGDAGVYSVVVSNECNSVTNSATLTVIPPPSVYIVQPQNNAQETAIASFSLNSVATSYGGQITNVVYKNYLTGTILGSNSFSPYPLTLANLTGGTNVYQAIAYDNRGQVGYSPLVTNMVGRPYPFVQIFQPQSNSEFVAGESILIGAKAYDLDDRITNVLFGFSLGTSTTYNVTNATTGDLYYLTWTNPPQNASNTIYAIAYDNDGYTATSSIPINVQPACDEWGVSNLILSASEVTGGQLLTGTVILSNQAATGGQVISLSNSLPYFVNVPPTVYVPQGQWSNSFEITTYPVGDINTATIGAGYHGQTPQTANLTVDPPADGNTTVGQHCGPMDVVFVIDTTGSMGSALYSIENSLTGTLNEIVAASGGDYRLGLVTFNGLNDGVNCIDNSIDHVYVQQALAQTNKDVVANLINNLGEYGDGGNCGPECSDEALNTVINALPAVNRQQCGDFTTKFRSNARKIIILVTDAEPGGFYDCDAYSYSDVIRSNDVAWTAEAAANGIQISAVNVTDSYSPERDEAMHYYADNTGGVYAETSNGTDVGQIINSIIAQCGTTAGNVVLVRDDVTRNYASFTVNNPRTGAVATQPSQFDATGIWGSVTAARLLRAGTTIAVPGSTFDAELGVADTNGQTDSYGLLITNANLSGTNDYFHFDWALPNTLLSTIGNQLNSQCFLQLTDRVSSLCGTAYKFTDEPGQPQSVWPLKRNTLTMEVKMDQIIPQGRCRSFVLTGTNSPVNGTWDIVFRDQVIASSGNPNGWDVEFDHTAFGGFIVTVPTNATVDMGYQVRVIQPNWDTGRSVSFGVVPVGSISSAPVLLPLRFSTNMVNLSGDYDQLTVSLDAPAPYGDAYVTLKKLDGPTLPNLPSWVVIPAGQTSITTNIQINSGSSGPLDIEASYNGYRVASAAVVGACDGSLGTPVIQSLGTNDLGIILTWSSASGALTYNISHKTNNGAYAVIFTGLTSNVFVDPAAVIQATNYYFVTAVSNRCSMASSSTNMVMPSPIIPPAPWIIPYGGVFNDSVTVLITNYYPGLTIYYTTNGTAPSESSDYFTSGGTVTLTDSATIKAFAEDPVNFTSTSRTNSASFTIVHPAPIDCDSNYTALLSAANAYSTVQGVGYYCSRFVFTNGPDDIGKVITLSATSTNFYPVLYLNDDSTNILSANYDSVYNGTNSQIVYRVGAAGTNIVEVTSFFPWSAGDFNLTMDCVKTADLGVYTNACTNGVTEFTTNSAVLPVGALVDFGLIDVDASVTNYITLTNSGADDLVVSNITIVPNADDNSGNGFTIAPTNVLTIHPGDTTNLAVSLFSAGLGSFDGYFVFSSNDGGTASAPPVAPFWAEVRGYVGAAPGKPFVNIYFPTNGMTIQATNDAVTNVVLEINAVAIDPSGIWQVVFSNADNELLVTDSAAPYTISWTNPPAGAQTITAVAYDANNHDSTAQASVNITVGSPSLMLSPTNDWVGLSNTTFTVTATLLDALNDPVDNSNVTFTVSGAHNFTYVTNTEPDGSASFTYTGTNAGADLIVASAEVNGLPVQSASIIKNWARNISCGESLAGVLTNTDGFSFACGCAVPSHYTDFYSFTAAADATNTFTMTSSNFSTYMFLTDTNCNNLGATVYSLNTNDTQFTFTFSSNSTYIVEASSAAPFLTGNYTLTKTCGAVTTPVMGVLVSNTNLSNYGLLDMGTTTNQTAITNTFVITNTGGGTLDITGWSLYYGLTNNFILLSSPVTSLNPGDSTNIMVEFTNSVSGQLVDALILTNNDPNRNPFVINLTAISNPDGAPPTVTIATVPTNTTPFIAPASLSISAEANASGSGVTITNVVFIFKTTAGSYLIGNATTPTSGSTYTTGWTAQSPGAYTLQAIAYDSQGRIGVSTPISVSVYPSTLNHPPVGVTDYPIVTANSHNNTLDVLSNDYDADGDSLTITQIIPSTTPGPHGTATIVDDGKHISYTPPAGYGSTNLDMPEDGFTYQLSDGKGGTALGKVYVIIYAPSLPKIAITNPVPNSVIEAGSTVTLMVSNSDPANLVEVQYWNGDDLLGISTNASSNPPFSLLWPSVQTNSCGCGIHAVAIDRFGQQNYSDKVYYDIEIPSDAPTLYGQIDYPAPLTSGDLQSTDPYPAVIEDGLLVVTGNVYQVTNPPSGPVTNAADYRVLIKSSDGTVLRDSGWQSPTDPIVGGVINTNDLTTLQNDKYTLELLVRDNYETKTIDVPLILDSNLKIGVFSFSQQDLVVPAGGIPLAVVRSYNSMNPDAGQFGYSWTYALNDMDVKFHEDREMVPFADDNGTGPGYTGDDSFSMRTGGSRDITLTLPNGQRTTFYYYEQVCGGYIVCPYYYTPPGVHYTLRPVEANGTDVQGYDEFTKSWHDQGAESPGVTSYDFPAFMLTDTTDGTKYFIERESVGKFYLYNDTYDVAYDDNTRLAWIQKPSGERIVINPPTTSTTGGQFSIDYFDAAGTNTRSIYFNENTKGQITAVMDPASGANGMPTFRYEYDANTNLTRVERLVNTNGSGTYTTNTYFYEDSRFPHYLTKILDARNVPVARNLYDDGGKLIGVIDSAGRTNLFVHDITGRTETVFDRMGNPSTYVYDTRGNVTTEVDALGHVTSNTYDDQNNVTSTKVQIDSTTFATNSYAYDSNGNRTQVVDALGHTNLFSYDGNGNLLTQTDALGNSTQNQYDDQGNLTGTAQYDAQGNVIQQSASSYVNGRLSETYTVSGGNMTLTARFGYDESGNLTNTTDANNFSHSFAYDANGNQTSSSFTGKKLDGTTTNIVTSTVYDAAGRVTMTIDSYGNTNQTFYDGNGKVSYTVDRYGNTNSFTCDARGNVIQTVYPTGTFTRTAYDDNARPVLTTDQNGISGTLTVYDAAGRVTQTIRATNVVINLAADPNNPGQTNSVIVSTGVPYSTNSTEYFDNGWVKSRTGPDGQTTTYTYYADGQTASVTDPLLNQTHYFYDEAGHQTLVWDALNHGTRFVYDAVGRQVATVFNNGTSVTNQYNDVGQRTGTVDQAGRLTQFAYNVSGVLTNVIKPAVSGGTPQWNYQYDDQGHLLVTTDANGHCTTNDFDEFGRQARHWLAMGQVCSNQYDASGRLTNQFDYKNQRLEFRYDNFGRVTNKNYFVAGESHPSNSISYFYNQLGQLTNITQRYGADAAANYAYLDNGNHGLMASLNNYPNTSGGATTLALLALGLALVPREKRRQLAELGLAIWDEQMDAFHALFGGLVGRASPLRAVMFWKRGSAQNLSLSAFGGEGRGEVARRRRIKLPSHFWRFATLITLAALIGNEPGVDRLWTARADCVYPANGSENQTYVTTLSYDFDGHLTQANTPEGVINYGYELATGRMLEMCTTNSEIGYGYDALGRLATVTVYKRNSVMLGTPEVTTYHYDAVGDRSEVDLPNGVVSKYAYDDLNRLTNLMHTAGSTTNAVYAYQLDATGRRTNAVEILLQEGTPPTYQTNTLSWAYDGMYRLTNEVCICSTASASYTNAFVYDLAGNRTTQVKTTSTGVSTVGYIYDSNDRLTSENSGGITYQYDANGSLTNKTEGATVTSYAYDAMNKLVNVNGTVSYRYNEQGIRVSQTVGTTTTHYLVDANNHTGYAQVLEELVGTSATPSMSYVIGDEVLGQATGGGVANYFLMDGHGNNRQLAQMDGTVADHFSYDAYGNVQSSISTSTADAAAAPNGNNAPTITSKLYCGEQYDSNLEMYNLRARYYNPANGRFNQMDTFEGNNDDPITLHKYLYANCDPVNGVDPTGHEDLVSVQFTMALISWVGSFYISTSHDILTAVRTMFGADENINNLIYILEVAKILLDAAAIAALAYSAYKISVWLISKGTRFALAAAKSLQTLEKDPQAGTYLFENLAKTDQINPANLTPSYQIVRNKMTGTFNYVVMPSGELRLGVQGGIGAKFLNKHIDLSNGQKVLAAGEAIIEDGKAVLVDDASGHYNGGGLTSAEKEAQKAAATTAFQNAGLPLQRYQSITP